MPVPHCMVAFTDAEGLLHSIEVQAESLYEAAILRSSSQVIEKAGRAGEI